MRSKATRRSALAVLAALGTLPAAAQTRRGPRDTPKPRPRMGINIAGLAYWNTELPFTDLMRMSGEWQLWRADTNQPLQGARPEVDARGWLRALPEGVIAMLPLAAQSHLPDSRRAPWVVRFEGQGEIDFVGALRVTLRAPGRLECEHVAQSPLPDPSLWLRIARTDPGDPLRNIRVLRPGTESQPAANVWDSAFIARWSGWAALRFMDLQATNNSPLARWSERPLPEDRTYATKGGLPLELVVDLANRCQIGPWLCMPHRADDDYLRRAATLLGGRLHDRLGLWVEHSNEVWNPDFEQAAYASQQGMAQGLGKEPNIARWRWHAKRSREIFAIWSQPFAGTRRLTRVLATQADNAWGTRQLLADAVVETTDALAVSAYLGLTPRAESAPSAAEVGRWPLERVFEHLERELDALEERLTEHRRWCARHSLLLVGYEGGQHLVGVGDAAVRDAALERLLTQANRDERMGVIYRRLFDRWQEADGDLLCHFSGVSASSRWGHWGLFDHYDEDPNLRPKWRVTYDRMKKWRSAA